MGQLELDRLPYTWQQEGGKLALSFGLGSGFGWVCDISLHLNYYRAELFKKLGQGVHIWL